MIALFTDFGVRGPYVGQLKAALLKQQAADIPVLDLLHDAPVFDARASAHLLAALATDFPPDTVFLGVIDPGVGSVGRRPVVLRAAGQWFVGPDNGLFDIVARRSVTAPEWREIVWRPETLSHSFHGRDLFAPVAAMLARGELPESRPLDQPVTLDTADDLADIIYIDAFGNAMTGLRASGLPRDAQLQLGEYRLRRADTFSDVPPGQAFWYENSLGLAEVAVNQGSAVDRLGIRLGQSVDVLSGNSCSAAADRSDSNPCRRAGINRDEKNE